MPIPFFLIEECFIVFYAYRSVFRFLHGELAPCTTVPPSPHFHPLFVLIDPVKKSSPLSWLVLVSLFPTGASIFKVRFRGPWRTFSSLLFSGSLHLDSR